jgi:hypothetical protein
LKAFVLLFPATTGMEQTAVGGANIGYNGVRLDDVSLQLYQLRWCNLGDATINAPALPETRYKETTVTQIESHIWSRLMSQPGSILRIFSYSMRHSPTNQSMDIPTTSCDIFSAVELLEVLSP